MKKTSEIIWQDEQHQVLFELIDHLKLPTSDKEIFARLESYAENHFLLEEAYMRQLSYPNAREHIDAHNRFRAELQDMKQQSASFDQALRESISTFLKEWLTRHVMGIDKDLERYILASQIK